jgi:hypothetical protein
VAVDEASKAPTTCDGPDDCQPLRFRADLTLWNRDGIAERRKNFVQQFVRGSRTGCNDFALLRRLVLLLIIIILRSHIVLYDTRSENIVKSRFASLIKHRTRNAHGSWLVRRHRSFTYVIAALYIRTIASFDATHTSPAINSENDIGFSTSHKLQYCNSTTYEALRHSEIQMRGSPHTSCQ